MAKVTGRTARIRRAAFYLARAGAAAAGPFAVRVVDHATAAGNQKA